MTDQEQHDAARIVQAAWDQYVEQLNGMMQEFREYVHALVQVFLDWFNALPLSTQQYIRHLPARDYLISLLDTGE